MGPPAPQLEGLDVRMLALGLSTCSRSSSARRGLAAPGALLGPSGVKTTPQHAAAVDMLKREDIPLTGGQATGSKKMMRAESQFGGDAAQDFQEEQLRAFTKAQLKFAGVSGDIADPDTLQAAQNDAVNRFSSLASMTTPVISGPTYQDMLKVADDYALAKGGNAAPILENIVQRAATAARIMAAF